MEELKTHELSAIKKTIAVMSGKGGVGKSSVTSLIAVALNKKGYRVGVLDADITGPSIPKVFGINNERCAVVEGGIFPVSSSTGIEIVSMNLLIENEESPVIWRGPLIANTIKQFYTDTIWSDIDYLVIDLPPGTGDAPLSIMQSIPMDGIIIVTTPQELVQLIVKKSINMAKMLNVPILGVVENMSYLECPHCGKNISLFNGSKMEEGLKALDVEIIDKLPLDPEFANLCDEGKVEQYTNINPEAGAKIVDYIKQKLGEV